MGLFKSYVPRLPLIVVGNITVGGTGKTPCVIALVEYLKQIGYRPGIVSRGYGGHSTVYPMLLTSSTQPEQVGDEPVLLFSRTQCPVVVAPKRIKAIKFLQDHTDCNIIISDDGLQHLAMKPLIEIMIIDGKRGLGNGRCLPAGPLREPATRCQTVDFLVVNTDAMQLLPDGFIALEKKPIAIEQAFTPMQYPFIHVVTGIGHPERFLKTLTDMGFQYDTHIFPDHHFFIAKDFDFPQNAPIVMTEKDAVKCQHLGIHQGYYLKITAQIAPALMTALKQKLLEQCP